MKLVRFCTNGQSPGLGGLQGERTADLQASLAATLTRRGAVRAQEIAAALVPSATRAFLEGGVAAQDAIAGITAWVPVPASTARPHPPIPPPGKSLSTAPTYPPPTARANHPSPKDPPR